MHFVQGRPVPLDRGVSREPRFSAIDRPPQEIIKRKKKNRNPGPVRKAEKERRKPEEARKKATEENVIQKLIRRMRQK